MSRLYKITAVWLVMVAVFCFSMVVRLAWRDTHTPNLEFSVVLVMDANGGHGSGVYIGNGNFITAAHVVVESDGQMFIQQGTTKVSATVVWFDTTSDVALVHTDYIKLPVASL